MGVHRSGTGAEVEPLEPRQMLAAQGLTGQYFSDMALGHLALTRTDAAVDFNWGHSSAAAALPATHFSARWTGQVLAPSSGKYTFRTTSDDGVRLWVDGSLLINDWHDHSATTDAGSITLQAGRRYDVRMEYYQDRGRAIARLLWKTPGQGFRVIPTGSLFPAPVSVAAPVQHAAVPAPSTVAPSAATQWGAPITITQGGVYSGHWQSLSANTPAVRIATSQPVVIQDSLVRGRGNLIEAVTTDVHLTVQRTKGFALNPLVRGRTPGRFIYAQHFDSIDVENNTLEGTSGIFLAQYQGDGTAANTVTVLRNSALNIDGRYSDGAGGFLLGPSDHDDVQFCQLANCVGMSGVDIGWNQVINHAGQSRVEDNISIFESNGTAASPILIHDNYIQGAYAADPATQDYSGGGIMLGDGTGDTPAGDPGFVQAFNNQIVSTTNYGIAVATGHDDSIYNNRVVSSGYLPDGTWIHAQNTGAYVWNGQSDPQFGNIAVYGNVSGWVSRSSSGKLIRTDWWLPNVTTATGNVSLSGAVTLDTEAAEYALWLNKLATSGVRVGWK